MATIIEEETQAEKQHRHEKANKIKDNITNGNKPVFLAPHKAAKPQVFFTGTFQSIPGCHCGSS